MIISDEQVRLALEYLQTPEAAIVAQVDPSRGIPAELVERVRARLQESPDVRFDRVAEARRAIEAGVSNEEVAGKMIGRIISDAIR